MHSNSKNFKNIEYMIQLTAFEIIVVIIPFGLKPLDVGRGEVDFLGVK